jgi:hypothetical protein
MALLVIPTWTDPDGQLGGPLNYPAVHSQAEAGRLIDRAARDARIARGKGLRVSVVDDLTGRTVARYRPRSAVA